MLINISAWFRVCLESWISKKYYLHKKQILLLDSIIIWGVWISEGQISEVRIRQFCCTDNFEILVLFVEDWPTSKNFTAEECNQIIWCGWKQYCVICYFALFVETKAIFRAAFGRGTGPIFLDNVRCGGTETSLLSCSHRRIGRHNCGHHEDAGVECPCRLNKTHSYETLGSWGNTVTNK